MTRTALTAAELAGTGKGILAADESVRTMNTRLQAAGVPATEENRRAYREMLITTPDLTLGISGVILCDETFRQRLTDGRTFPEALGDQAILPGIKVDTGAKPLPGSPGETITEGLDGLRERLTEYMSLGARFAKWRAVIRIGAGDGRPSWQALSANAHALARYASLCQEAGLVPIVEPEVLMDGAHGIDRCREATQAALLVTFGELNDYRVDMAGLVLKPNMVLPGQNSTEAASPETVATQTLQALRCVVPDEVGGVAFLSGGQGPARATANLAAMPRLGAPWPVTFSFGRALVDPSLAAWHGDPALADAGRQALANRVACNVAALQGSYTADLETSYALA